MAQPPGGHRHGRVVGRANGTRGVRELDLREIAGLDLLGALDGNPRGVIAWAKAGDGGLHAHRGILYPGEYVDEELLASLVEDELGCSIADARAVYGRQGGGPCPRRLRPLRDRLDGVMAGIASSGGNLAELARRLGVPEQNLQRAARGAN
jgi:hypothetical protein